MPRYELKNVEIKSWSTAGHSEAADDTFVFKSTDGEQAAKDSKHHDWIPILSLPGATSDAPPSGADHLDSWEEPAGVDPGATDVFLF